MVNVIFINEMLTDEQLDGVSGGYVPMLPSRDIDVVFFEQLGYSMFGINTVGNAYAEYGIQYTNNPLGNYYKLKVNGEWCKHPHWAVMGYVLSKKNYPGFTGKWTDGGYVQSFIKEHFGIKNFD